MTPSNQQTTAVAAPESIELLRYKEELAGKIGLPSSYAMNLLRTTCEDMVASGFAPACFKSNPSALFMAVMRGKELDLGPMESILETFWSSPQGRLGMMSTKMGEIMRKRGVKTEFLKDTDEECEVLLTPPNGHPPYTSTFHIDEAKRAGLVKPDSNWVKWPRNMLRARAISNGWRAIGGTFGASANIYSQEEIQDMEANEPSAPAIPESTEVKAGVKPKAEAPVTVDATAEAVADKVVPIRETPPPETSAAPTGRTLVRAEHLVYCGGKPASTAVADFATAANTAQALRDKSGTVTEIEKVGYFSDGSMERKMVARFDPEPAAGDVQGQAAADAPVVDEVKRAAVEAAKARFESMRAALPAKDDEARKKIMAAFGNGYFGVGTPREWPKNAADRMLMMDSLAASLERQTDRDFVISSPMKAGQQARVRAGAVVDPVYRDLKWSPETIAVAVVFRNLWAFQSDADFLEYANMFLTCDEPDAYAYMRMAIVAGRGSETLKLLRDVSKAIGEPYGAVVGSLAKFVGELTKENVAGIEAGLKKMLAHAAAAAAPVAESAGPGLAGSATGAAAAAAAAPTEDADW